MTDTRLTFTAIGSPTPPGPDADETRWLAEQRWAELEASGDEVDVEWRVVGDVGPGYPVYDFVWHGPDAEAAARRFLALDGIARQIESEKYALRLYSSTVRRSAWTLDG